MTTFYESTREFRAGLKSNSKTGKPLKVGFRLRPNGHACVALDDAMGEAIRAGWYAHKRVAIDRTTMAVIFAPRPTNAQWSAEDIALATSLLAKGELNRAGLAAFESRREARKAQPSEPKSSGFSPSMLAELKRHPAAWANFQRLPSAQRERQEAWVASAKQEKTRADRFAKLLMDLARLNS